ncbi:MAG TPA: TonB-dependent receptor [Polyangia bacterium]|nr:TonB-dependent receptor [Polyangia bacterium]
MVVLGIARAALAGQAIEGRVIDAATGLPVAGATVHVQGTKAKVKTGAEGQFTFPNQAEGTWVLEVSKPPFLSTTDTVVVTAAAPPAPVELLLIAEDAIESIKVEEIHKRESPAPGGTELVREEIQKMPGSRGDFMSTLQSLPGIANTGTFTPFSSGLIIRGSDPSDARILVDGFEIPILYHFGAVQAILPSEMIGEIVYAPGGFGVEHGRASAGIIEVRSRSGQPKLGGFAELSFVNGAMFLQGPIGKNATFALSMRRSVVDAVLPAVLPKSADLSFSVLPRYYDWQARLDWKPTDSWKLALFYFGSDDNTKLSLGRVNPTDPGLSGDLSNRTHFDRLIASATYTAQRFTNRLALSADITRFGFEMSLDRHLRLANRGLTVRDEATWTLGSRLTLHGGAEGMGQLVGFDRKMPPPQREGDPNKMNFATDPTVTKKADFTLPTVAAWTSADLQLTQAVSMTGGVRYDGFLRNGTHLVQPRLELRVTAGKNTFRGSGGLYSRPPYWEDEVVQANLGPEKSWQTALGWEREILPRLTLQTTAFYTLRSDLIMFDGNPRAGAGGVSYVNEGRGKTYGAELLLTWRGPHHFAWVAYTLSRSTRQDGPNAPQRLFDFDQTHNLVLVGSRSFGKNDQWQLGGRFQFTTGKPYTPVVGTVFMADLQRYQPIFAPVNSSRMEPMHQLDLRLDHWWQFQHWKLSTYLDIQNVYYHASTMDYRYNQDFTKKTEVRTLPILPSFGVRGEF